MAHPRALGLRRGRPHAEVGAIRAGTPAHRPTKAARTLALWALAIGVTCLGLGLSMLDSPDRAPADQLGVFSAFGLSAAGLLMRGRRTGRAPRARFTPPRLDAHQDRLIDAFAPLLEQVAPTLQAAGSALLWSPGVGIESLRLTADATHGLLRVAREALEETQRQASQPGPVRLELDLLQGETGSHLRMAVIDMRRATHCPAAQSASRGHELSVAERHATQLGAQLDVSVDASGWRVELVLQLATT